MIAMQFTSRMHALFYMISPMRARVLAQKSEEATASPASLLATPLIFQGVLLQEVLDRSDLTDVSSGCLATGPSYTYCSGSLRTKIDHALSCPDECWCCILAVFCGDQKHGGP